MKKYVVLLIAITISAFSFAQKTELKGAEKALKSNNFASAKTFIKSAEAMESSMDLKTLAKFYFLKGQQGDHRVLEPYYTPTFGDFFPPAPKRPRSKGHGYSFDKKQFDAYLKNLKIFLV